MTNPYPSFRWMALNHAAIDDGPVLQWHGPVDEPMQPTYDGPTPTAWTARFVYQVREYDMDPFVDRMPLTPPGAQP